MADERTDARILVLDRDPESCAVVKAVLEARGNAVLTTGDPAVVLDYLREHVVEAILVDLAMEALEAVPFSSRRRGDPDVPFHPPVQDGLALLRPVEADPGAASHPLVGILAAGAADARRRRFGVVDFIPKPIDGEVMRLKLASVISATTVWSEPDAQDLSRAMNGSDRTAFTGLHQALRTALVVDADPRFRKWFRGLLALHGFRVHEAASGDDGLQVALSERPWLIVSDLNLLGSMSGIEFCRRLRARALTGHTPFLFLSDSDGYDDRYAGLSAGADDFLTKRSSTREVLIRIQLALKRFADLEVRVGRRAAIEGRIELVGTAGLLQMCHLAHLSGTLSVRSDTDNAEFTFIKGDIVGAGVAGLVGRDAVFRFLGWPKGRFEFSTGTPPPDAPIYSNFDALLLEGCRLLDEGRRRREQLPPALTG